MKKTKVIVLSLVFAATLNATVRTADSHRHVSPRQDVPWTKFDEYSNIPFEEEKARLNEFISVLRSRRSDVAYIVAYAGRQACVGEARQRANRVKTYLQRAGIRPARLKTVDAGHKKDWQIELYIALPISLPDMKAVILSADGHIRRADVRVIKCKNVFDAR